ncbi:MarR family transcriptional regulator [Streptomyces thermoalcalitolerans]|uniref:MarR family transcriptional regulator n=1 Tax=Streptomyces thermoalcalitolerans TaxID=65605 RepID=A0ABP3ZZY2_9ACTN
MAGQAQFEELVRQLGAIGAVKRDLRRILPPDCPAGAAGVLSLLGRRGDMRMSGLAELLSLDMSVISRHVAHLAAHGWIERLPDPADKRSRILRLTPAGTNLLDELYRRATRLLAERLGDWSDDEIGRLIRLLKRLHADFGECRTAPDRHPAPLKPGA